MNNESNNISETIKKRDSNLELFRIITMLLIVAHHYVVNSGLTEVIQENVEQYGVTAKSIFYLIFGAWGKTGINCFVLITGYFMCKSQITKKKFVKLLIQIYFYKIVIYLIFLFSCYEPFSPKTLLKAILPFTQVDKNFTGCFLIFYLCIPFLNLLVGNMTKRQHELLLVLSLSVYVIIGTVLNVSFNYVTWFCILYFISSYIRLYPLPLFKNTKFWLICTLISVLVSCMSIIGLLWIGEKIGKYNPYFFVADSNKIFAVCTGVSSFMLFKNLKIYYNPFINAVASTCFGVLLIHANSDTMRRWLWGDLLHNVEMYDSRYYIIHAIVSVICIFCICSLIDWIRIKFIYGSEMAIAKKGKH